MEDYSRGNQRRVWPIQPDYPIPEKIRKQSINDPESLRGMYVRVNMEGRGIGEETITRILDLNSVPWHPNSKVMEYWAMLRVKFRDQNELMPYLVQAPAQRHF